MHFYNISYGKSNSKGNSNLDSNMNNNDLNNSKHSISNNNLKNYKNDSSNQNDNRNNNQKANTDQAEMNSNQAQTNSNQGKMNSNQDQTNSNQGKMNSNQQTNQKSAEKNAMDIKTEKENEKLDNEKLNEYGQVTLDKNPKNHKLHLLTIIGEIEGHECLPQQTKTTKYEHILPQLAALEDNDEIEGVLVLVNTIGGAVESGLAIAEMIASLSKPTVSLIIGDSHSIGVPLAVATDYAFIVPTGTVIIHPVRMSGTVIDSRQTYDYFKIMKDRIIGFIADHSHTTRERLEEMMFNTTMMSKDLGTILVGSQAVDEGIADEVGGIHEAIQKLYAMIEEKNGN